MGKKFGVNTKAEEGRARKAAVLDDKKQQAVAKKELEENKKWQTGVYKNAKKDEEEAKRLERLAKKREREELEQRERAELEHCKGSKSSPVKASVKKDRSIAVDVLRAAATEISAAADPSPSNLAISPNASVHSDSLSVHYSASNLDDALCLLESLTVEPATGSMDRHPERRMKAAYAAFEEREMPGLKAQNPGLRHSQLKERLFRAWQKAPENPFNQAHIPHTATRQEEVQALRERSEQGLERFRSTPPP